jgi:hypothetical protein
MQRSVPFLGRFLAQDAPETRAVCGPWGTVLYRKLSRLYHQSVIDGKWAIVGETFTALGSEWVILVTTREMRELNPQPLWEVADGGVVVR